MCTSKYICVHKSFYNSYKIVKLLWHLSSMNYVICKMVDIKLNNSFRASSCFLNFNDILYMKKVMKVTSGFNIHYENCRNSSNFGPYRGSMHPY